MEKKTYRNNFICFEDWHVHNFVSHDGTGSVEDFVLSAIEKGIKKICFVNHPERPAGNGIFDFNVKDVIRLLKQERNQIEMCREKYFGQIDIFQGIEIENRTSLTDKNKILVNEYDFDIVFGSCHLVDDISISSSRNLSFFVENDKDYVYKKYFENLMEMFDVYDFDVLAHLDIIKRYGASFYGKFDWSEYIDYIDEVIDLMVEKKIGMEINTSGFFQFPEEPYPQEELVSYALSKGVPFIVTGTDSHSPQNVGRGLNFLENLDLYNKNLSLRIKKEV